MSAMHTGSGPGEDDLVGVELSLRTKLPGTSIFVEAGHTCVDRIAPELRGLAMSCIAAWSIAERGRIGMVTSLTTENHATVARDLFSRNNAREQGSLLKMLANAALVGEPRDLFFSVLDRLNHAQKRRDELAHGLWAVHLPEGGPSFSLLKADCMDRIHVSMAASRVYARVWDEWADKPDSPEKAEATTRAFKDLQASAKLDLADDDVLATHNAASLAELEEGIRLVSEAALMFGAWRTGHFGGGVGPLLRLQRLLQTSALSRLGETPRASPAQQPPSPRPPTQ